MQIWSAGAVAGHPDGNPCSPQLQTYPQTLRSVNHLGGVGMDRIAQGLRDLSALWAQAQPTLHTAELFLANPWTRAVGLLVIVYLTIRVISSVYSGDKQNSELGPVAIRQHTASRDTIVLPRSLMPMNMDGVSAKLKVLYVFTDSRGRRRKQTIYENSKAIIAVSPIALRNAAKIDGQEVPDVPTSDVCFPPVELDKAPTELPATPDRALDYVALHKIIENWHEDDNAVLISMHPDERDRIRDDRRDWLVDEANKVRRAREGNLIQRMFYKGVASKRANVVGSYYLRFEFSHDPWFVLTRHPDRDLKMTAWLTVLTSVFALIMDAWPKAPPPDHVNPAAHELPTRPPPRIPTTR